MILLLELFSVTPNVFIVASFVTLTTQKQCPQTEATKTRKDLSTWWNIVCECYSLSHVRLFATMAYCVVIYHYKPKEDLITGKSLGCNAK